MRHLIFLLCLLASGAAAQSVQQKGFLDAKGLALSGAAQVSAEGHLVLTPPQTWTSGSVYSARQIETGAFSTFFAFRISAPGNGGADGIAFVLQNVSSSLGAVGGGMGYQDVPNSLAIEFDTWQNVWGPDDNHVGLLLNGSVAHRDAPAVSLKTPLEDGQPHYVWLDYDGTTLSLRHARQRVRPSEALAEYRVDVPGILGSDRAYVGFASATGAASAQHEILEWTYLERFAPAEIVEGRRIETAPQAANRAHPDTTFSVGSELPVPAGTAPADPRAFLEARGCTIGPETQAQAAVAGVDYAAVAALAPALSPPYTVLPPEACTIRLPEVSSDWPVLDPVLVASYQTGPDGRGCFFGDTAGAMQRAGADFDTYLALLAAGFLSGELRYYTDNPLGTPPGVQVMVGTCGDVANRAALDASAAALTDTLFDAYVRAKGAEQRCDDPGFTPGAADLIARAQNGETVNYLLYFELDIIAWAAGFRTGMSWSSRGTPVPPFCHLP